MRRLVVFYSLTGVTRKIAERAARELGADIVEVQAPRYKAGFFGFIRAAVDRWKGRLPQIEMSGAGAPSGYDFVLVCGPVWASHAATPARAFLQANRGAFKRAAFLLTCGGRCPQSAFDEMAALAGVKPEATFIVTDGDNKKSGGWPEPLSSYIEALKRKDAA